MKSERNNWTSGKETHEKKTNRKWIGARVDINYSLLLLQDGYMNETTAMTFISKRNCEDRHKFGLDG